MGLSCAKLRSSLPFFKNCAEFLLRKKVWLKKGAVKQLLKNVGKFVVKVCMLIKYVKQIKLYFNWKTK